MSESTTRLGLPLLHAGQAQKEMTHNEALALLDLIVQPYVIAIADIPPETPEPGDAWLIGDAPEGAWTGRAGAVAGWSEAGWRYVPPSAGMRISLGDSGLGAEYREGSWIVGEIHAERLLIGGVQLVGPRAPAIASPIGGSVIDGEARAAILAVLSALRDHGLIGPE
jgi:hypothetical protein